MSGAPDFVPLKAMKLLHMATSSKQSISRGLHMDAIDAVYSRIKDSTIQSQKVEVDQAQSLPTLGPASDSVVEDTTQSQDENQVMDTSANDANGDPGIAAADSQRRDFAEELLAIERNSNKSQHILCSFQYNRKTDIYKIIKPVLREYRPQFSPLVAPAEAATARNDDDIAIWRELQELSKFRIKVMSNFCELK